MSVEGYERRLGYTPVAGGKPVPGVGPILGIRHYRGAVYVLRSDGEKPMPYVESEDGWEPIVPIWEAVL